VLEGSALSYYTSQPKADTNPKGTLGLKGAKLTEEPFANAEKKSLHYFQLITVDKGTSDVRVSARRPRIEGGGSEWEGHKQAQ
jgi:hypothetical protein